MELINSVLNNNLEEIKKLIEAGNDLNVKDEENGYTALHYCAQDGKIDFAILLIQAGALIDLQDNYGNTPLFKAVYYSEGKSDMIKLLLKNGSDPNKKNNSGVSALDLANRIDNYDLKKIFKQ